MKYSEIRHNLKTGDIVLFSGKGLTAKIIRFGSRSKFHHVGLILRSSDDDIFLLHSTANYGGVKGVQVEFFSNVVKRSKDKIFVRHIIPPLTGYQVQCLKNFRRTYEGTPYETNLLELILAGIGDKFNIQIKRPTSSLFCSEMVIKALQAIDVLPLVLASHSFSPADLSSERDFPLKRHYTDEIEVESER